jgi:hypothetical protein
MLALPLEVMLLLDMIAVVVVIDPAVPVVMDGAIDLAIRYYLPTVEYVYEYA